jgi:hypothetical protein
MHQSSVKEAADSNDGGLQYSKNTETKMGNTTIELFG